jgi:Tol biopolymer transport system component
MSTSHIYRIAALPGALALCTLATPAARADGGGGSSALFSLDRFSAARHGVQASDILVDDPWYDNAVVVALPGTALRLGPADNLDALCFGLDNGIPGMWPVGNDMNWPWLVYQFSAGRGAVDGFTGPLRIPFEIPAANPLITVMSTAEEQFPNDQAADVFTNKRFMGTPPFLRNTSLTLEETADLELVGSPPEPSGTSIDELDALSTAYGAEGGPDEDDGGNGELDAGLYCYFSVDDNDGDPSTGLDAAAIYLLIGDNTPVATPIVYLSAADLGLQPGDDIDALSVWDPGEDGLFDDTDGVVISLRRGSPSIPFLWDGVLIDEGAIMLYRPDGFGGVALIDILPGNYMGLAEGDELDALISYDPREDAPYCTDRVGRPVLPNPSLVLNEYLVEAPQCTAAGPCPVAGFIVAINDPRGLGSWPAVQTISVTATLAGDTPAAVIGAGAFICGTPPGDPPCCGSCFAGSVPPCPPGIAGAFYSCRLDEGAPPVLLDAWNQCIGQLYVALLPGGPPGWISLTVSGSMTGPDGSVMVFEPVQAEIRVIEDCDGDGIDDPVAVGHGLAPDCNDNDTVDSCDIVSGFSLDCPAGLQDGTARVSLSSAGGEADGLSVFTPSLSADGRFIVFTSAASGLAAGDDNAAWDVFLRDRDADEDGRFDEPNAVATFLVSRALDGTSGSGTSRTGGSSQSARSISADGRYVVFDSTAADLVAGDTATRDVFLWDRVSGTITKVAPAGVVPNDASYQPAISADGRYVAYVSQATNLVAPDNNSGTADIYVWDRQTSGVVRVNVSSAGAQAATYASENPALSADGRYVVFESRAANLVTGDTNAAVDIFRHDRDADGDGAFDEPGSIATIRASLTWLGAQAAGGSDSPCLSDDGRYVGFRSLDPNFVPGDTNGLYDIFVRDVSAAAIQRASVGTGGTQANGESLTPALSADGHYVAFASLAYNLSLDDDNFAFDMFVHDRIAGRTILVSRSSSGALGNGNCAYAGFDGANRVLAFVSEASNLAGGDYNLQPDVFIRRFIDCNGNGAIDRLETDSGANLCTNGVPDECEVDCNCNGVGDTCEIAAGLAYDLDGNSVPDDCEIGRRGDLNCDGLVDFFDIDPFVAALLGEASYLADYPDCRWLNADCDQDCDVDFFDIDPFVALIGT